MSSRPHPADQENEIERHAFSIALFHGPRILSKHGLRYYHFTTEHAHLFRLLEVAASETASGVPELIRIHQLASNEADSGIPSAHIAHTMALLTEGGGDAANASWYAEKIMGGYRRREVLGLSIRAQLAVEGETGEDLAEIVATMAKLLKTTAPDPTSISLPNIQACVLTGEALMAMQVPQRPRLMGDWLRRGDLGFIFAPRGVGKTWLSMALPHAISAGVALGLWPAGDEKSKVLYLDGEMPLELSKQRHTGLSLVGSDVAYLHHDVLFEKLGRTLNIADPGHQEALTELLIAQQRNFLVLDNLSCLASGVDENKGMDYEPISGWLLELRRRGITVIMVHHAGRSGFMRGHSKREDAASWILELSDAKEEGQAGARFITRFAKPSRNTGEHQPDLLWHFTTDGDPQRTSIQCEPAEESEYDTMLRHVGDGVETVTDLAEIVDKPKGTISKWVKKGVNSGRLKRQGQNVLPSSR